MLKFINNNPEFDQNLLRIWTKISSSPSPPRTLLLTSSVSGEGCTTIATHLARIKAEAYNEKILLIEGNFKNPSISYDPPLSDPPGFSDILLRSVSLKEAIQPSPIQNLLFLGPGSEKLGSLSSPKVEAMKRLLAQAKEMYDFILLDGPPALEYPEIAILSNLVDGTILIVQANKTTREDVQRAKREIMNLGGAIIGCILNRKKHFIPKEIYQKYVGSSL